MYIHVYIYLYIREHQAMQCKLIRIIENDTGKFEKKNVKVKTVNKE